MDIFSELKKAGNSGSEKVARFVARHPENLDELLNDMVCENKRVKNAAAKAIRMMSETHPEMLIPHYRKIFDFIHRSDTILKWIAIDVVGNMAYADDEGRINTRAVKDLCELLADELLITAAHSVEALGKIAENRSRYRRQITEELQRIEIIERNAECRNILLGKTIDSYSRYWEKSSRSDQEKMYSLAKRQLSNQRGGTRKRAERFIKRFGLS